MRYKVILSADFAVEIISELEQIEKNQILKVIKEFNSYNKAKEYILSKECVFSSYFVVDIAEVIMVISKRHIEKYSDFTLLKAFVTPENAEKYRDDCYTNLP